MLRAKKTIGLIAHDKQKEDLVEWVKINIDAVSRHDLVCTGTTGMFLSNMVKAYYPEKDIKITLLKSGPLGGDQQMGAMIVNRQIDILIFMADPMTSQPHDVDIKALTRIALIYNIPIACNLASADFFITSPLFDKKYDQKLENYSDYIKREI